MMATKKSISKKLWKQHLGARITTWLDKLSIGTFDWEMPAPLCHFAIPRKRSIKCLKHINTASIRLPSGASLLEIYYYFLRQCSRTVQRRHYARPQPKDVIAFDPVVLNCAHLERSRHPLSKAYADRKKSESEQSYP